MGDTVAAFTDSCICGSQANEGGLFNAHFNDSDMLLATWLYTMDLLLAWNPTKETLRSEEIRADTTDKIYTSKTIEGATSQSTQCR